MITIVWVYYQLEILKPYSAIHILLLFQQYYKKARASAVAKCFHDVATPGMSYYLPDQNGLVSVS